MEFLKNLFKVILLALVEGITEFLPVSSTGHLILINDFIKLQPESFANSFNIIIQPERSPGKGPAPDEVLYPPPGYPFHYYGKFR